MTHLAGLQLFHHNHSVRFSICCNTEILTCSEQVDSIDWDTPPPPAHLVGVVIVDFIIFSICISKCLSNNCPVPPESASLPASLNHLGFGRCRQRRQRQRQFISLDRDSVSILGTPQLTPLPVYPAHSPLGYFAPPPLNWQVELLTFH